MAINTVLQPFGKLTLLSFIAKQINMSSRLTKKSRAVQVLREKFENGDISDSSTPNEIWETDPLFRAHTLNHFRTCFNSVRTEYKADSGTLRYF